MPTKVRVKLLEEPKTVWVQTLEDIYEDCFFTVNGHPRTVCLRLGSFVTCFENGTKRGFGKSAYDPASVQLILGLPRYITYCPAGTSVILEQGEWERED